MVTHGEFVNQIRDVIGSLNLVIIRIKSHLAMGFWPDLQVMCGVDEGDRIFIDAINTRASLDRDIGALLKLKANYDKRGIPYRRIFAVCSESVKNEDLSHAYALEESNPKFHILRTEELKGQINIAIKEALREKLEQLNQEQLEFYFSSDSVCHRCGEPYRVRGIAGVEWECMNCGFRWKQKRPDA